jgi:hypothetical protein
VVSEALELSCSSCGATLVVGSTERTTRCPYCDSPAVVDRPATHDRPDPVFVIPFAIDRTTAVARLRSWLSSKRWAPGALRRATAQRSEGVYLPAYLYTAIADSGYRARIGEDYQVRQLGTRGKKPLEKVTRTEYRDLVGSHCCGVDGILVTASGGIDNDDLEAIEPYDLGTLRRYTPALVSGWTSEEPSLPRARCLELAQEEARHQVHRRLHEHMPGDSCTHLAANTELREEAVELTLLPVWVCAVRHHPDRDPVRLLVNGQTGAVHGRVPVAWARIAAVVGVGLLLLTLLALLGRLL